MILSVRKAPGPDGQRRSAAESLLFFVLFLAEFGRNALGRLRVREGDRQSFGALARGLVEQADALRFGISQLLLDILAGQRHVVDADAAVLDVLGDGRVLRSGFQQLDLGLAEHEEGRADLLVGNLLDGIAFQAQYVLPVGNGFIQALHCDAKMLDMRNFHSK